MNKYIILLSGWLLFAGTVCAQGGPDDGLEAVPPPPDIPDPLKSGDIIEPEVTIIRQDGAVIEEYRINGNLYMVKITPSVGKPYYLIDRDGDGTMEYRSGKLETRSVPQWVIFSW